MLIKKNPSTSDVKLGDDDDDDYIPITKMITCRSFNNCCPKGVELGRRLGESGGATTIQKLAVQMLSNQVPGCHHYHH